MFFNQADVDKVFRGDHYTEKKQYACEDCKLKLQCDTPKVSAVGKGGKRILILAGNVHKTWEDSRGENKGPDYQFIKRQLKRVGIDMEEDCWFLHAIRCYTKEDATPKTMSACHSVLVKDIAKLNPAVIVPIEYIAFKTLKEARDAFEKAFIIKKLEENNWNISKTAEHFKIERSNLHKKIKAFDIKVP